MKTIEQRLSRLESQMNHANSALHDLGMRPVHYPNAYREHFEWMHHKEPGLLRLPHPVEGEVFIKCGFLKDYHTEIINLCEDDIDPIKMLTDAGSMAFTAWRNAGSFRDTIGKWIPEIVSSRGDYGACKPQACRAWAERMMREYESERNHLLYEHGAIGGDSYEDFRNLEDNVQLAES